MVFIEIVPSGEEVVSVEADGTEVLLPQASVDDAFAATVKKLNLHKRRRLTEERKAKDEQDTGESKAMKLDEKNGKTVVEKEATKEDPEESKNPFHEVQRELSMACYELRQLNELTNLISEQSLFRLEHLQADEKSGLSELTDTLMAFDMKKIALEDAIGVLKNGLVLLQDSRRVQKAYLHFIRQIQSQWRMQAIAHGTFTSNLRAQEPLAVDCGFFSAGSIGKYARVRQTRNAARLIVNDVKVEEIDGVKQEVPESTVAKDGTTVVELDADESSLRTIQFAVENSRTGEVVASSTLTERTTTFMMPTSSPASKIEAQLEALQNSEFCTELFQVLSVEAVRAGELSSGGGFVSDPSGIGSTRNKVAVVENLLDRVSVSLDTEHVLSISLVPVLHKSRGSEPKTPEESQRQKVAKQFCKMAGIAAESHLRTVHKGIFDNSLLLLLVDKYRQMDALERISREIDSLSTGLTQGKEPGTNSRLFKLSCSWTHRDNESFVELYVGPQVLVRCKLVSGHLMLGSISLAGARKMPYGWQVAQQGGDHIFACPNAISKLRQFLLNLIRHEFLLSLKKGLLFSIGEENLHIHMDVPSGTISWVSSTDSAQVTLFATVSDQGLIHVRFQDKDITRPTIREIVTEAMLLSM